jgi:DNA-binding NtrC family response regulator
VKTTVEATGTTTASAPRHLLVTAHGALRVHPLPEAGEIVIGRGRDCDVVLDHPKVSRQHLRLGLGPRCAIVDLGSRNGTLVHGQRLAAGAERQVDAGESFAVGPFTLLLLAGGTAAPPTPVGGASLRVDDPAASAASPLLTAVARAPVSVIIHGETGTGKEVLAATLHRLSGRKGPFLGVNCAALSETLLESELFGHERGAFTGAEKVKPGLLEAAAGGTVLLDEIGEMAPGPQAKLLRAIEAREVLRVGAVKPVALDVRFLAATHRELLSSGQLRRDLYYRLAGITLEIPPLRQRRDRIGGLAAELLAHGAAQTRVAPPALSAAATAKLMGHDWPGNVRELRNVIDRALLLSGGAEIRPEHILFDAHPDPRATTSDDNDERARIIAALDACAGNQTRAARALGISRATLVTKLAILRIPRPRKR